jgi:hypothetical protein
MWEFLTNVLTSDRFWVVLIGIVIVSLLAIILSKLGILKIDTKHVRLGESDDSLKERLIIKSQLEASHDFIFALENKLIDLTESKEPSDFMGRILEEIYDKTVLWITANHIKNEEAYISCKQREILNYLYTKRISEPFKTPEFKERVKKWVEELIDQLADIRELYSKQK